MKSRGIYLLFILSLSKNDCSFRVSFQVRFHIIIQISLNENLFARVIFFVLRTFSRNHQRDRVRNERGQRLRETHPRGDERREDIIYSCIQLRDRVDEKSLGSSRPEKKEKKSRGRHFKSPLCVVSILHAQRTYTRTHTHTYVTRTARSPAG